jgi:hypothetical protein
VCPTRAIVGPYELDARRCISYLTIEHKGSIPEEFRGDRQPDLRLRRLPARLPVEQVRARRREPGLPHPPRPRRAALVELIGWSREEFDERTEGSAIRRIGHERFLRNVAVALGNGPATDEARAALLARRADCSELVREHVDWALARGSAPSDAGRLTARGSPAGTRAGRRVSAAADAQVVDESCPTEPCRGEHDEIAAVIARRLERFRVAHGEVVRPEARRGERRHPMPSIASKSASRCR